MSKEAYYFSHDANARNDPKILAMREDYGVQGYGAYWIIIEMLREQENFKLPFKKYIWSAIAMQMQCKEYAKENAKKFVDDCIHEYELFESDDQFFWSNSLIKRMEKKNDISEKRKAAAKKRWENANNGGDSSDKEENGKSGKNANAEQNDANAMQNDANKKKGNKKKGNKITTTTTNDTQSIIQFWDENGFGLNNMNAKHQLLDWIDDGGFKEPGPMILKALEIASAANKRNLRFVEGILRNWYNDSCATLADVEEYQRRFEKKSQDGVDWEAIANG